MFWNDYKRSVCLSLKMYLCLSVCLSFRLKMLFSKTSLRCSFWLCLQRQQQDDQTEINQSARVHHNEGACHPVSSLWHRGRSYIRSDLHRQNLLAWLVHCGRNLLKFADIKKNEEYLSLPLPPMLPSLCMNASLSNVSKRNISATP